MIPLYDADGALLAWVEPAWAEDHAAHLRLVRTRRARAVVRAYLKPDSPMTGWLEATARRSSYGCAFQQSLDCGRRTWALKGTPGSR